MILDDLEEIKKLDKNNVADSIAKLPEQIEQAWGESKQIQFPQEYKQIKNIFIDGMGGSGLGPEVVRTIFQDKVRIPVTIAHGYHLPGFIDQNSLVFISSYSGNTEEPLNAGEEALAKGYKVTGITSGGKLKSIIEGTKLTGYIFDPKNNPSGQPRLGLGYLVGGIMGIFQSLGLLNIEDREVADAINSLRDLASKFSIEKNTDDNFPKEVASKIQGSTIAVVAGETLSGNAHVFANQLNETSKTFSMYHIIPELNHHLLEGLNRPDNLGQNTKFIFLESDSYSDKIKKRLKITKEVIEKQKVETISIRFEEGSYLNQSLDAILVSSYITFYLGILNGFDPSEIPWVNYFKEQLAKD